MKKAAILLAVLLAFGAGCKKRGNDKGSNSGPGKDVRTGETVETKKSAGCSAVDPGGVTSIPAPAGEVPDDGDALVRRLPAEPGTLNPLTATDAYEQSINYPFVIETLLDQDLATGELKPLLAESWDVSPDKLTFTFHLRKDVKWHDGKPLTVDDVVFTYDKLMDPKVDAASYRSYFGDMESYEKIDDYTFLVKWKKPYFKSLEMIGGTPVLPKHALDDGTDFNKHPYGRAPLGSGPYVFDKWETGQRIVLKRNPNYWGKKPHFDSVVFKILTNDDVALSLMKKGELDTLGLSPLQWVYQTGTSQFNEKNHKIHYHYPGYSYIGWNLRKPLFQDKRVRKALTMLLNREAILEKIYYCLGSIQTGPYDQTGDFADPDIKPYPFDPKAAGALLAEAGWTDEDGDGILDKDGMAFRFEMSFTAQLPEVEKAMRIYKEDLRKAGIDMEIRTLEWAVFLQNVQEWKFDATALGWALASNPDSYQLWHSSQADIKSSSNHVGFKSARVDELIELNREEFDRNKRIEYCREIHRVLHEEQPYTFFISSEALSAVDKRIHNVVPHPIRPIFLYNEWYVPKAMQKRSAASL